MHVCTCVFNCRWYQVRSMSLITSVSLTTLTTTAVYEKHEVGLTASRFSYKDQTWYKPHKMCALYYICPGNFGSCLIAGHRNVVCLLHMWMHHIWASQGGFHDVSGQLVLEFCYKCLLVGNKKLVLPLLQLENILHAIWENYFNFFITIYFLRLICCLCFSYLMKYTWKYSETMVLAYFL